MMFSDKKKHLTAKGLKDIPYRTLAISYIIWSNSSWSPIASKAGFYCDDTSIKESYHGDSISAGFLFLTLLGGASLIIYLSELLVTKPSNDNDNLTKPQCKHHLHYYFSGFLYVLTVTEILKGIFCELRPHFFYTCLPDMSKIKCSDGLIKDFNCTGSGPDWLIKRDIYKSFPSGHASLSFYCFIFLSIYIKYRSKSFRTSVSSSLWGKTVVFLSLLWTITCCISRLVDHRHFWWDVLFGILIGFFGGIIMASLSLIRAAKSAKIIDTCEDNNNSGRTFQDCNVSKITADIKSEKFGIS